MPQRPADRYTWIFVTGTDTGVGKTAVAAGLVRLLASRARVVGLKPVASGARPTVDGLRNDDALALAAAGSISLPYELTNPFCFGPAVAPHLAAREAGVPIPVDMLVGLVRARCGGRGVRGRRGCRRLARASAPGRIPE